MLVAVNREEVQKLRGGTRIPVVLKGDVHFSSSGSGSSSSSSNSSSSSCCCCCCCFGGGGGGGGGRMVVVVVNTCSIVRKFLNEETFLSAKEPANSQ